MSENTGITQSKPPYVAYKTFENFIKGLRESSIPDRIDRSMLNGLSGAAQSNLLATMKFLGFTNDAGAPTPSLRMLVENPQNEKAVYTEAITKSYGFLFNGGFNLKAATEAQVLEKFREKDLGGDTVRKCLSFFVLLSEAAGQTVSPHLKVKRSSSGNGSGRRARRKREEEVIEPPAVTNPSTPQRSIQEMLLEKFPSFDPKWDAETQKKWFASFEQFMQAAKK